MNDHSPLIAKINGRHSLIKPPMSVNLRSGSVSLKPGEEVGEHKTENREEAIVVLSGTATVICEGEVYEVKEKQFVYIPPESVHNIINNSKKLLEYVYIVTPVGDMPMGEHSHSHSNAHSHSHSHNI